MQVSVKQFLIRWFLVLYKPCSRPATKRLLLPAVLLQTPLSVLICKQTLKKWAKDGNLELLEDNIGLRARATITDPETVKKARNGDLVGWSFGFQDRDVESLNDGDMPTRAIKDLDLFEVSLLDRSRTPAYDGTLVTVRSEDDVQWHGEAFVTDIQVREIEETVKEEKEIDYSKAEAIIKELKED